jgi:hypothetical protein
MADDRHGGIHLSAPDRLAEGEDAVSTDESPPSPGAIADKIKAATHPGQREFG